jgi:hypothetical protein
LPVKGPLPEEVKGPGLVVGKGKVKFPVPVEPVGEGLRPVDGFPEGVEAPDIGEVPGDSPVKVRPEEVEDRDGEVEGAGAVADPDA